MTTKLIIDVKDISAAWIAEVKQRFKGAQFEIIVHEPAVPKPLDEERFWEIIALLDWSKGDDDDAILAPAVEALQQLSVADIQRFQDLLAEKLYALDQQAFAEQIGAGGYGSAQHFSVDVFLYARACVVANGKDFYHRVLRDPAKMPKGFTFEALLYLAAIAYQQKTGERWEYLPKVSYETFSNREGWGGKSWVDQL